MRSRIAVLPFVFFLAVSLIGCGGDSSSDDATTESNETSTTQSSASGEVDQTINIKPKGNQMQYQTTEFTVAPGQTIRIVMENVATSPSMEHNVVVINSIEDEVFERVGEGGMSAGSANDYIPEDDAIIAYTPMAKPGETVEVTFTVPQETGEYGYLCTFPGHWATMQGTMHVEEGAA